MVKKFFMDRRQMKSLQDHDLPELKQNLVNANIKVSGNNIHLHNRYKNKDFIVAGSGPSIARFNESFRKGKIVMSLCGAHSTVKGDILMQESTPAGWNGLKDLIDVGQNVLIPSGVYHNKFLKELKLFSEINFESYAYSCAPKSDLKWYHKKPPYTQKWSINEKTKVPYNVGPQTAPLAVSLAIVMGASNIYIIGVDGYADLLKENKSLYLNTFCNNHYKQHHGQSKKQKDSHIEIRELRDMADRYIFSQILNYCKKNDIGIYLLNKDSHLKEELPLANQSILV